MGGRQKGEGRGALHGSVFSISPSQWWLPGLSTLFIEPILMICILLSIRVIFLKLNNQSLIPGQNQWIRVSGEWGGSSMGGFMASGVWL